MKTILASLAAAGVLVAGAFIASTLADAPADAQVAQVPTADMTDTVGPLVEVLDGLVTDGVLTQTQADEVRERLLAAHTEWWTERRELREERRADRQERRAERRADRELIRGFLEDGVIDSDELAQLGDDHPFNDPDGPWADVASDGQITREELARVAQMWHERRSGATEGGKGA
ncbi:MAG TPA: hypothetical protein VLA29_12475 [Acidimicrobiia bacterium]|nr:hypothetical protein [Acidimicrobiia bacterium]